MNINENYVIYYLLGINIIGALVSLLSIWACKKTEKATFSSLVIIASLLGAGLGVLIPVVIKDIKPSKKNMLARVIALCMTLIYIMLVLIYFGSRKDGISTDIVAFLKLHTVLTYYIIGINLVTFIFFGVDKYLAIKEKNRIKITSLLGLSFVGGSLGGILGMALFRHKTRKPYFYIGLPLMVILQILFMVFLMNI